MLHIRSDAYSVFILQQPGHACSSLLISPAQAEKPKAEDVKAAKASKAPAASSSSSATAAPASSGPSAAASAPAAASDSATQPPAKATAAADGAAPKEAAKKVGAGLCMPFCVACRSSPTSKIPARAEPYVVSMAHTARKCCDCYPGLPETLALLLPC